MSLQMFVPLKAAQKVCPIIICCKRQSLDKDHGRPGPCTKPWPLPRQRETPASPGYGCCSPGVLKTPMGLDVRKEEEDEILRGTSLFCSPLTIFLFSPLPRRQKWATWSCYCATTVPLLFELYHWIPPCQLHLVPQQQNYCALWRWPPPVHIFHRQDDWWTLRQLFLCFSGGLVQSDTFDSTLDAYWDNGIEDCNRVIF